MSRLAGLGLTVCLCHGADRRKSEELSEEEEEEEEERRQAAVEVVGEMQLTAEQLKVASHSNQTSLLPLSSLPSCMNIRSSHAPKLQVLFQVLVRVLRQWGM